MKLHTTLLLLLFASWSYGQAVVDFEDVDLAPESFLNGDDGNGGFTVGDIFLPNDYNPNFSSWSGWAISNTTDVTTPGFSNQYSAIPGTGAKGSATYAVSYDFGHNDMILQGDAAGKPVSGLYITNSTFAYLSMLEGDGFAKRFGGATGDDPDYFLLTFRAFSDGNLSTDSVNFYLADYRFDDNDEDYIVQDWTWVDLSSLGAADSISFSLSSTDNGQFGMNTPAYFCVDNVFSPDPMVNTNQVNVPDLMKVYPNPTTDFIHVTHDATQPMICSIYDETGRLMHQQIISEQSQRISLQQFPSGNYVVMLTGENIFSSKTIVKN